MPDRAPATTGSSTYQPSRRISPETKAAVKTTELLAFIVVVVAVLIASQIVDGCEAQHAWLYASMLTIGYLLSPYDQRPNRRCQQTVPVMASG